MMTWMGDLDAVESPAFQIFAAVFLAVMFTRLFRFVLSALGLGS